MQRYILAIATFVALAFPAFASANLTAAGPTSPLGFPAYYEDSTGLQVGLCIEDPGCPASPAAADMVGPDGEAFYQLANAEVLGKPGDELPGADVTVDFNVEGAFLGTGPNDQITFGRLQFTAKGLMPNSKYTVEHPYGTSTFKTGPNGTLVGNARAAQREEVGCGATPCDFNVALGTKIDPFLRSTSAPPGYLGNGIGATVTGGPVRNTVTVSGPGLPTRRHQRTGSHRQARRPHDRQVRGRGQALRSDRAAPARAHARRA